MTESLSRQMVLQRLIERALDNFKKVGKANLTAAKIRTRIASLKENWTQFRNGHASLLSTMPAAEQAASDYFRSSAFDNTEDVYLTTWEYMTECLENLEPVVSPEQSFNTSHANLDISALSQSHMPKINLPPFDGSYSEWESFRDRFSALIIKNMSLSDFARMHYLASSLKGRALDSISNISITADNFQLAWDTLTARFENKRRLIASHFSTLFGLSIVNKESAPDLQLLCDKYNIAVASLKVLGRTSSDLWDDFLVYSLTQKLDPATRKAWNLKTCDFDNPPSYEELIRFLSSRIRALEECISKPANAKDSKSANSSRVHVATASVSVSSCPLCKSRHYLSACPKFIAQNPNQRRNTVKQFKRCFNCLSASHSVQECKSQYSCRSCSKRHHSLLHSDSDSAANSTNSKSDASASDPAPTNAEVISLLATSRSRTQVLLATARVQIGTDSGRSVVVRALLDQGSEATFISESLAQSLRVKKIRMPVSISAVGGAHIGTVRHAAAVHISPVSSNSPSLSTTALILTSLTSYAPRQSSDLTSYAHLSHLKWADSDPTSSEPIHVIIGADLYSAIIRDGIRAGHVDQPIAQNSIFGWLISGPLSAEAQSHRTSIHLTVHHCTSLTSLSKEMQQFWTTEELPHTQFLSPLEEKCEAHFLATHSRASNGQYIVRLPFKANPPIDIGHSRSNAERQFRALSRRFASQPDLRTEYHKFMREYEDLNHMRRAPDSCDPSCQYSYIPHHPVFRADSVTTRLRVVFNASSVTTNGTSLNDHLLAGPKLQAELPAIILQWRQFRFVYTADIAKMYRQILIDQRDVDYQRIFWQPDSSENPCEYQLLTVTYGMTCAPYLALRVIRCLAEEEGHRFPRAVPILRKHIYVDDVLFGDHDLSSLRQTRDQLLSLLRCGNFELRKWASNSSVLLEDIDPSNHGLACSKSIASDESVKVLGIVWNPSRDNFQFHVSLDDSIPKTKRTILSTIARLYDPLGWVTPAVVATKIFMQRLWRAKIDWDTELPDDLFSQWRVIYTKLPRLNEVTLDRWTDAQPNAHLELHGFADASTLAYAASVYLKITSPSGAVKISLLAGKSKVAPLNPLTVPRLELSAALLLTRLVTFVQMSLDIPTTPCFCWTDSTIVLTWIRSHPSRWTTFVANRVNTIQTNLPNAVWRHVPTSSNPADCASRGMHGDELLNHNLWWHGPPWLQFSTEDWPQEIVPPFADPLAEEKILSNHITESAVHWDLASRFSSWAKLIRVTAYLFKFANACRRPKGEPASFESRSASVTTTDCSLARTFWIRNIQSDLFSDEVKLLSAAKPVASKSSIAAFHPFLDQDGVLRVGGRLQTAPLPFKTRHPILLAPHPLVRLIVAQTHFRTLHGGPQLTLNALRQEFWILRARNLVKSVIHQCVTCIRERASTPTQLMGNLPAVRVSPPARSFAHCGLDYAGPVKIRASAGRGITSRKAYIALFICLATRAIHLELVSDYSTAAFLSAFARFCSRRGLPQSVYSDNGTTFVGADKELTAAYQAALRDSNFQNKTAIDNISWHFIPPSAPHFGGLWEAGVRCVKHHLRRILGDHALTFEEFTTLLCQVEACLNSRPLAPLSDSFDEYQALTPSHFLIGSVLITPPEPSVLHIPENRLTRWQLVRQVTERFWKMWTNDYVNTLQQRQKWRKIEPNLRVGSLVLLRNPTLPPCKWELGRIAQLHPGSDGLTRVVTIKTAASEYTRPIGKICVLPIDGSSP